MDREGRPLFDLNRLRWFRQLFLPIVEQQVDKVLKKIELENRRALILTREDIDDLVSKGMIRFEKGVRINIRCLDSLVFGENFVDKSEDFRYVNLTTGHVRNYPVMFDSATCGLLSNKYIQLIRKPERVLE